MFDSTSSYEEYDAYPPMSAEWVVGRYTGERAKSVMDHANAGIGYFILQQGGKGTGMWCLAAFVRPLDSPTPEHLTRVTDRSQLAKLEARRNARMGQGNQNYQVSKSFIGTQSAAEIMAKHHDL
jgi:hypothetical protein